MHTASVPPGRGLVSAATRRVGVRIAHPQGAVSRTVCSGGRRASNPTHVVLTLALSTRVISISPWTSMSATVVRSALRAGHRAWRRREDPPRGPRAAAGRRPLGNLPSQRSIRRVIGEHDAISQLVIAHDTRRGRRSTLGRREDKHGRRPPGARRAFTGGLPTLYLGRPMTDIHHRDARPRRGDQRPSAPPCPDRWSGFFSQNGGLSERQRPTP
jgi:hypothetical protein